MRQSLMAGASRFAHFGIIGRKARAEDAPKDDEPKGKKSKAEGDDDAPKDDDEPKGKASKARADDDQDQYPPDDDDQRAEGDDNDEDVDPKAKNSKASDDDDETCEDDDEEMRGKSAAAGARRRERARCAAIFAHPAAAENPELACSLAFETTMTRQEARAVLAGQVGRPTTRAETGAGRRARNPDLGTGGGRLDPKQAVRKSWDVALAKVGVKPAGA